MNFLDKLYNSSASLSILLLEAKSIAEEYDDNGLLDFINREIEGYKAGDEMPEYRKIKSQIVADIQDVYGHEHFREKVIDFSLLSEKLGFDLEVSYSPDGISFLETMIKDLTKTTAIKPIPTQLVKMLDETFHYNNPQLHITKAYHKIPTASLRYILEKVRQDLILSFQKLSKLKKDSIQPIQTVPDTKLLKSVFITYAWEDENFNSQIVSFVNFLRTKGFDAFMDRKKTQEENSINLNKMMIEGIQNSDKVIVVLTERYKEKADKFEGGVGVEYQMVLEDIKVQKNKYILTSFGNKRIEDITPVGLKGRLVLDLKKDQDENNFNELFSRLKEENTLVFVDVNVEEIKVEKIEIKPFKL